MPRGCEAAAMGDWLVSFEGTPAGRWLALGLALAAAFLHAVFGALQKGRHDPWLSRGAIDLCYGLMAAPVALFLVPRPEPHLWPMLGVAFVIHTVYKLLQAGAYVRGAYTVVYPITRGTGALFAVAGAWVLFFETFTALQWLGVMGLLAGIFGLAVYNLRHERAARSTLFAAILLALATGLFVALYTTWDAHGVRSTRDPFTFLAWFFMIDGFAMPVIAALRWPALEPRRALGPLLLRGVSGGAVALLSFGAIMLATRFDKVGQAAVLRETSSVFAALIGWLVLREPVGMRRLALMGLIALGAVIVGFGG